MTKVEGIFKSIGKCILKGLKVILKFTTLLLACLAIMVVHIIIGIA